MAHKTYLLLVLALVTSQPHPVHSTVQTRVYTVEANTLFSGLTDLPLSSESTSRVHCAQLCTQDSYCQSFSFNTTSGTCWKNWWSIYHFGATTSPQTGLDYVGSVMEDITDEDWVLAFRAQAQNGVGGVLDLWRSSGTWDDSNMASLNFDIVSKVGVPMSAHYRSRWIDLWSSSDINEVKFALYKAGNEVVSLVFDGHDSTNEDWFSHSRLISSSYTDLVSSTNVARFSLEGFILRSFYASEDSNFFNCAQRTWLFVQTAVDNLCSWTSVGTQPVFIYSNGSTVSDLSTGEYDEADVMAVFIKFN